MSIDYTKTLATPAVESTADVAKLVDLMRALADEAYGTGCGTRDVYYAGVEDLARFLVTGLYPTRKFGDLMRGTKRMQLARADVRDSHSA